MGKDRQNVWENIYDTYDILTGCPGCCTDCCGPEESGALGTTGTTCGCDIRI